MPYSNLQPPLVPVAVAAEKVLKDRFNLGRPRYDQPIHDSVSWRPTLHWKTKTGYMACEVSERPFAGIFKAAFAEISSAGLPIRIIAAYPKENSLSTSKYQDDLADARRFGIGLLSVDNDDVALLEYAGVSVCLHVSPPDFKKFKDKKLRTSVHNAYDIYMTADPAHGVQELGQLVDDAMYNLAVQAKQKNILRTGGFDPANAKNYALGNLIDDLMRDRVIDNGVLGRCRGFVDDRNGTSHKPHTLAEATELEERLKNSFKDGLFILQELPSRMHQKGFLFHLS